MFSPKITAIVQFRPGEFSEVCLPVEQSIYEELFTSIDIPRPGSSAHVEMQRNIDALQRAIDGTPLSADFIKYIDTKSILIAIQKQLPEN